MNLLISCFLVPAILIGGKTSEQTTSTPAERRISAAEQQRSADTKALEPCIVLGRSLVARHRESGSNSYLDRAESVIGECLQLAKDDFEALKVRVQIHLARAEYEKAIELAGSLHAKVPDDVIVRGLMVDAYMALGNYKKAEEQAQWVLDLRRTSLPGLIRGAKLRELFGDTEGALEWLGSVYRLTSASETEERAWLLTQSARLQRQAGKLDSAMDLIERALKTFPGYHLALREKAEVQTALNQPAVAVGTLRELLGQVDRPEHRYALAVALNEAGQTAESKTEFEQFETAAVVLKKKPDNANRELILYYAKHDRAIEAMELAEWELERRRDVDTLGAAAAALLANGKLDEALKMIDQALAPGIKDPELIALREAIRAAKP